MTALDDALRAADAAADRFVVGKHIPGLAYGIIAGGALVHARGIGTLRVGEEAPPDADSVFRIASMTKSFTAATVLRLRDEGRLVLDAPVATYVPELANLRGPTADAPRITVRHLLTMTSGLATDDPWGDRQQGLDLGAFSELLRGPLTFAWTPGTRFEYSNLGYGILGRVVTAVAGMEYRDVVRDRLLDPLGLDATTYLREEVPPERLALGYLWRDDTWVDEPIDGYGALAAMGGIFTSVRDLARWVGFLLDADPPRDDPDGHAPLSRASRREMATGQSQLPPGVTATSVASDPSILGAAYGMGLFVDDDRARGRIVGHSGGYPGFGSNMRWHPATGLGVIVLANHRYGPSTLLARDLLNDLIDAGVAPARRVAPVAALAIARRAVERLMAGWDDDLAARTFAMNVELDQPLALRRAAIEALAATHGALRPSGLDAAESATPLHLAWWLDGERGRVRVTVRLSPESPPRVQTFEVLSVPAPSAALQAVVEAVVDAVNAPAPGVPASLALDPGLDPTVLGREARVAAARYAPVEIGSLRAGDGSTTATWRLVGPYGALDLTTVIDPISGLVTALGLAPRLPLAAAEG